MRTITLTMVKTTTFKKKVKGQRKHTNKLLILQEITIAIPGKNDILYLYNISNDTFYTMMINLKRQTSSLCLARL